MLVHHHNFKFSPPSWKKKKTVYFLSLSCCLTQWMECWYAEPMFKGWGLSHEFIVVIPFLFSLTLLLFTFLLAPEKESQVQLLVLDLNGSQNYPGFHFITHRLSARPPPKNVTIFYVCYLRMLKGSGDPLNYIHVSEKMVNDLKISTVTSGP